MEKPKCLTCGDTYLRRGLDPNVGPAPVMRPCTDWCPDCQADAIALGD